MDEERAVFISHKQEDLKIAQALAKRIKALKYNCYLDATDSGLHVAKQSENPLQAVPEHLRDKLRKCRLLIFVASANSPASRWMPWETGFFDGRYDKDAIGIYLTDDPSVPPQSPPGTVSTVQEYLNLYTRLTDDSLEDFLKRSDNRSKMNVHQGQIDQLMLLLRTASENPREFSIGCLQWGVGFWRSVIAQTYGETIANAWLPGMEAMLGKLRNAAAAGDIGAVPSIMDTFTRFTPNSPFLDLFGNAQQHGAAASQAYKIV